MIREGAKRPAAIQLPDQIQVLQIHSAAINYLSQAKPMEFIGPVSKVNIRKPFLRASNLVKMRGG